MFKVMCNYIELLWRALTNTPLEFRKVEDDVDYEAVGESQEVNHLTVHDCAPHAIAGALTTIRLTRGNEKINGYVVLEFRMTGEHSGVTKIQPCHIPPSELSD